jgi:hypothetical protein
MNYMLSLNTKTIINYEFDRYIYIFNYVVQSKLIMQTNLKKM